MTSANQQISSLQHISHKTSHQKKSLVCAGNGYINVSEMTDSTCLYDRNLLNVLPLLNNLQRDGYLLLRNIIPPSKVKSTRKYMVNDLKLNNFIIPSHQRAQSGYLESKMLYSPWPSSLKPPNLLARHDLMLNEKILTTIQHPSIQSLMYQLLSKKYDCEITNCSTLPYKWLRAVGTGLFTGPHMDRVYLPNNPHLLTCWIPLGDIPINNGAIIVASESHVSSAYTSLRKNYGSLLIGSDKAQSGWITHDPSEMDTLLDTESHIDWKTTDFKCGDVCIFGLDMIHMTATNVTKNWRLSCDTRWVCE